MKIRMATQGDAEILAFIRVRGWQHIYREILPSSFLKSLTITDHIPKWEDRIKHMDPPSSFIMVAVNDVEKVIGYAWGGTPNKYREIYHSEIYAMYLLPEYVRQGIGNRLFHEIRNILIPSAQKSLIIWALSANPACHFYHKMGGLPRYHEWDVIGGVLLEETGFIWENLGEEL